MIKHFCDKCKKELTDNERFTVTMRVKGCTVACGDITCEYCEACFAEIVGFENCNKVVAYREERRKRAAERKKEEQP